MSRQFICFCICFRIIVTLTYSKAQYSPHSFCLKKVCEQTISGRHLPYPRILQILHSREYLNAVHIIPKAHGARQKRQAASATAAEAAASGVVAHSLNNPLLMSIPFIVLSAMFLSSLRKRPTAASSYEVQPPIEIVQPELPPIGPLPPPLVPPHLPQPGQPGGGYQPDHLIHNQILSLVPYGLIPVAVFPAHFHFYGDASHHFPSECVIFADDDHPKHFKSRSYNKKRKKSKRSNRRNHHQAYYYPPQHLYGFRCLVTTTDKKSCTTAKECQRIKDYEAVYGHGYFFQDFKGKSLSICFKIPLIHKWLCVTERPSYPSYPLYFAHHHRHSKRAVVATPDFYADDLPHCKIQDHTPAIECQAVTDNLY